MADNSRKTPFAQSFARYTNDRLKSASEAGVRRLPCSVVSRDGAFVTVKFEVTADQTLPQVKVPVAMSEWARIPVQVGDKGFVIAADVPLGNVTGLGGGVPQMNVPAANLTPLVFQPIGRTSYQTVDPDAFTAYGPNGVVLRDSDSRCTFTLTPSGIAVHIPAGDNMTITMSGGGTLNVTGGTINIVDGDVIADGISLKHHVHGGVQPGGGNTGEPVA